MATTEATHQRADLDIQHDIDRLERHYPPLVNDRHQVKIEVKDGAVTASGYTKSVPTYNYLLNSIEQLDGVKSVTADDLYIDEDLRRHVGHVVPPGISVNVEYGSAILAGRLPEDVVIEDLVKQVGMVEGIHRIVTAFI
mgnify:CR=1 FL=1